ncbi:amidohydrolase [Romboutsia sp.]|uniref:amidohydrolase n=1 Tax=Romboutsia sp. TaxID=1965302 RepID=UPI002CA3CA9D|nr:amidohydrolase [Romboutsia sp.]HSQ88402.1 amidohydrolase [Romboutsia sp.]
MDNILNLKDIVFNHRKYLNCIAERGREEFKTSKYIRDYLDKIGVEYDTYIGTATTGIIKGKIGNKTIAFRADIDGLTTEHGVKHLCGHDGHTSILLGLIEFINENQEKLNDNIVFIFQPAEEGPGGAKDLIQEGIMEKYKIDEIYGLHIYPEIATEYIGIREGYFMAQIGDFDIDIVAKSGHGAMPQNSIDGIIIAANLINSLQTVVSRNVSPIDSAVLSIGIINGGTKRNIIAENINLQGTIRTFDPKVYVSMKERMKEICKGIELAYNCKINVEIRDDYPSVNNDKNLCKEFVEAVGSDRIIALDPLMISEDFSYYQKEVPGLFFMLGSRDEEKGLVNGLHNINFNFDEEVLINGLETYIKLLKFKKSIN